MYLERIVKVIFEDVSVIRRRIKNVLKYLLEKLKPLNKFLSEIIMFIYLFNIYICCSSNETNR